MKKIILFTTIFILLLFPLSFLKAVDLIFPGHKTINYGFKLINVEKYPDYLFINYNPDLGEQHYAIIDSNDVEINPFDKTFSTTIYAIPKNIFDRDYSSLNIEFFNDGGMDELIKKEGIIVSNFNISEKIMVESNSPIQKIFNEFRIVSLDKNEIQIAKISQTTSYEDGTSEKKLFKPELSDQEGMKKIYHVYELPYFSFSKPTVNWEFFYYVILPLFSLITILINLALRKIHHEP